MSIVTLGGEIKALVDGAGTALTQTYRAGHVPDDAGLPFASFLDPISDVPALQGDSRTLARRRTVQVDIFSDEATAVDTIIDAVVDAIDGVSTTSGLRLRVTDVSLIPGPEARGGHRPPRDHGHHAPTSVTSAPMTRRLSTVPSSVGGPQHGRRP